MSLQALSNISTVGLPGGLPGFQLDEGSFQSLHRMICLKSLPMAGHSRFANHLALHFPEVANRIDEVDFGVLHLEVGALKLETRAAISRRNWDAVREHYAFVSMILEDAGADLHNAIRISYLGCLFYGETSLNFAKARSLLPHKLAASLGAVEEHYEGLVA